MPVAGIDGVAGGWVAASVAGAGEVRVRHGLRLGELIEAIEDDWGRPLRCIAIDMPIGLPERGVRASDAAVRAVLGPRRSSLFATPVRAAVHAPDWAAASAAQRALAGKGLSKQSYALRHGIIQVADWMSRTGRVAHEVHPELSFAVLGGAQLGAPVPMSAAKSTWDGQHQRAGLLRDAGMLPGPRIGPAGARVPPADVLDAAIAAWSARRIADGAALRFPAAGAGGGAADPDPMAVWA